MSIEGRFCCCCCQPKCGRTICSELVFCCMGRNCKELDIASPFGGFAKPFAKPLDGFPKPRCSPDGSIEGYKFGEPIVIVERLSRSRFATSTSQLLSAFGTLQSCCLRAITQLPVHTTTYLAATLSVYLYQHFETFKMPTCLCSQCYPGKTRVLRTILLHLEKDRGTLHGSEIVHSQETTAHLQRCISANALHFPTIGNGMLLFL